MPKDEYTQGRGAVKYKRSKYKHVRELIKTSGQHEHTRPHRLDDEGIGGRIVSGMNKSSRTKEQPFTCHRVIQTRWHQCRCVGSAEGGEKNQQRDKQCPRASQEMFDNLHSRDGILCFAHGHDLIDRQHEEIREIDAGVNHNYKQHPKDQGEGKVAVWIFYFTADVACRTPAFKRPEGREHRRKDALDQSAVIPGAPDKVRRRHLKIMKTSSADGESKDNDQSNVGRDQD